MAAGIVDQHVDSAELIDHGSNGAVDRLPVAVVGRNQDAASSLLLQQGERLPGRVAGRMIMDGDPGAFPGQPERARAAQAPARSGYQRDLAGKPPCRFHAGRRH